MTKLMEQAIERLCSLPAHEQDAVAEFVLSSLDGHGRQPQGHAYDRQRLHLLSEETRSDFHAGTVGAMGGDAL